MNPLKPMKSPALPTLLAVGILAFAAQQASSQAAITALAPNGIYVQTPVLTIGGSSMLDISGYAITDGLGNSIQNTAANAAVIASNPAVVLAARNGVIWNAISDPTHAANVAYAGSKIATGFNGGLWNGFGIASGVVAADAQVNGVLSAMLYDNTQLGYGKWAGLTLTDPNFRQTLFRVSYVGDFTGDGVMTADDFIAENGYLAGGLIAQGDLNGDAVINADDFIAMNGSLSNQIYGNLGDATAFTAISGLAPSPAPEPTSALLLVIGSVCFAGLRNRRRAI